MFGIRLSASWPSTGLRLWRTPASLPKNSQETQDRRRAKRSLPSKTSLRRRRMRLLQNEVRKSQRMCDTKTTCIGRCASRSLQKELLRAILRENQKQVLQQRLLRSVLRTLRRPLLPIRGLWQNDFDKTVCRNSQRRRFCRLRFFLRNAAPSTGRIGGCGSGQIVCWSRLYDPLVQPTNIET